MPVRRVEVPVGARFGKLVVLCELPVRKHSSSGTKRWFKCRCDCGEEREVRLGHLRSGHTVSCGGHPNPPSPSGLGNMRLANAKRDDYHGMQDSSEYGIWKGMKDRCYSERSRGYKDYGGRGIVVCSGWKSSFNSFFTDVGARPSLDHSIDRRDGNLNYSCGHCEECVANGWPANCRWATRAEQRRNARNIRMLEFRGESLCLKDMATKYGMTKTQLHNRLAAGWSLSDALLTPVRQWQGDRTFHQVPESERDTEWRRDAERRANRQAGT